MKRKFILSSFLLILTYLIPLSILSQYQNSPNLDSVQKITFVTLFLGSTVIIYLNWRKGENTEWLRWTLKILGILGFIYSGVIMALLFLFRHGIGF
ncbi:MAG: hypothetical protein UR62_C0001G0024 [Candidatus Nomurabacteria bacterium GW2011_GWF2_35_12]|uniref:Uncharacterized protein n=3 Tax=Candidatus Nomuraibacteriota TaxID=1752729 RepID=A0A0G0ECC0_9BACT|nr:MAG: hypothetical protein UR62_C0001G0024 [Candidatus Nomurabacteria bacterium GW2011_GWF2_35_12]KKP72592.1 MAG: hypothetical protein UR70_C0006G0043 [Candidatus Nomurabacteria bacterium GW2011_GWB1_35_20]KKP76619.1 MAG: hypothetical protein UR72_C0001G0064 [Parcubacteria group bacterium GW2011_GWC1_35_21]KKP78486.1 MAG: hypothetical protein UR77_C0002G0038 [Candidatus Nomurabacteria bacterium GW2011_GWC2_35_35]KKP88510.1 MAG: hypothetical protein UR92_C0003G0012 [Candidatus Nomurabacteria b